MNTPSWVLALFVTAAIAQIIACIASLRRAKFWWAAGFVMTVIVTGIVFYSAEEHYGKKNLSEKTVTFNPGTFEVDTFLRMLSQGEYRVVMDPPVANELMKRGIKIKTSAYQDVPFTYILDQVLTPQLPGPQQWDYEVVGKTIRIKRR
jgi:hypothetical protein